jgi:hypothetical protein
VYTLFLALVIIGEGETTNIKNRQKYISTIKIVVAQKGQARHLDEEIATMT